MNKYNLTINFWSKGDIKMTNLTMQECLSIIEGYATDGLLSAEIIKVVI